MLFRLARISCLLFALSSGLTQRAQAQADYRRYYDEDNLPRVREIFEGGRCDLVVQICDYALQRGQPSWEWRTFRFEALAGIGSYEEAVAEATKTTTLFPDELGALLRAHALFDQLGENDEAQRILADINRAASAVPKRDRTPLDLVHLGQAALVLGADPAKVLEQYYEVAKATPPKGKTPAPGVLEAYLATGELALSKDDFARAGAAFQSAAELAPEDARVLYGLARAFLPNDREAGNGFLEKLLSEYPIHQGALLHLVEQRINFERYEEAHALLDDVESMNPRSPEAFAYRAVLASLERNDEAEFNKNRAAALAVWKNNPAVDSLIGRVLSRKYRFREGAASQLSALALDPDYLPAKLELAIDYLRLGELDKAWTLAREVGAADPYNTLAYNLETLEKEIAKYARIESPEFLILLPPNEAAIFGDRALALLTEASQVLGEKYGLKIDHRTQVEFYPDQQDFAIRSFGELGGQGLLGVCSGTVVTMNSPGSMTAKRSNWEATLWHEYCHVVTLSATANKMPRWLSEGISVYEERQRQANWGQNMTPEYRRRILEQEDGLTPIGDMSQAFFGAKDNEDVIFAYYQSMLVVEYIVDRYGWEAMRGILADLRDGVLINNALARHTAPIDELNRAFVTATRSRAEAYGAQVDWTIPEPDEVNVLSFLALANYLKKNPTNFWAHQNYCMRLADLERWEELATASKDLIALLPEYAGSDNGYSFAALAYHELGKFDSEEESLEKLADLSAEALQAYRQLLDRHQETRNWAAVLRNASRAEAINPFLDRIHYCRGCAHEARGETALAAASFEKVLLLKPLDPSETRVRLSRLVAPTDPARSKRLLLDALADAPRYREGHALLLETVAKQEPPR
jgi:tetratricopeptide (TPR) repeat protein